MEHYQYFKSIIQQDNAEVVICDTDHKILYMNPVACQHYSQYGGIALVGRNLMACHNERSREMICRILDWFRADPDNNCVHTVYDAKQNKDVYMVALRDDEGQLIGYYEKHESRERDTTPLYRMD